jgi:integrase
MNVSARFRRNSTTVGDLVDRWFESHRKRLQPGTEFDYEQRIHRDISKIASYDALELIRDPSIVHDFYWNQLGPQSARNARTILLQAFEEAAMRKLIPENPAKRQRLPPTRRLDKDTRLYNESKDWVQVAKFLGHRYPGITMKLYANHVVEAGQRELGELAAAPWWG